jgi:hypothetical protein
MTWTAIIGAAVLIVLLVVVLRAAGVLLDLWLTWQERGGPL